MKGILLALVVYAAVLGAARVAAPRPPAADRSAATERVLQRLVAGAARLADAVGRVLDPDRDRPPPPPTWTADYPGDGLQEPVTRGRGLFVVPRAGGG